MVELFIYRKRHITSDDIDFISNIIVGQPDIGRCELSRQVCRAWNWVQPNGYLKDIVCRGLMLKLERAGLIKLPPKKFTPNNPLAKRKPPKIISVPQDPICNTIKSLFPVILRQVRKSADEKLFNSLVHQFHYLGYVQPVGEHLKYIAYADDRPVACLAFSSAPYHIGPRDEFIGWDRNTLEERRHLLAYNTRFLILPWVRVPHLASHLLGLCSRTINKDWQALYNHPVYWLETFVDTERFAGTCYKAANWIFLGYTAGRGKDDQTQKKNRPIKAMYGYPLVRNFRKKLCHG
ncbi:MAG: DUF4338 domain-containing protein [Desulfobacterales bacterium]|nr:DUF4338 domain-containing protein [Desulfobacterales bacterium]